MATGTATLNFGLVSARRATSSGDVTGQSGLTVNSFIEAFEMAESTAHHSADVVRVDPIECICQYLTASSFRIFGTARRGRTYGDRKVRWVTA